MPSPRLFGSGDDPDQDNLDRVPGKLTGIRLLTEEDRPEVRAHLLRLPLEDRLLRFASAASDAAIDAYASSMPLDGSLGLFLDGELVGVAHLPQIGPGEVEIGISIEPRARACGWGHALLHASIESTHANGARTLTAQYVADNRPMAHLLNAVPSDARQSGAEVVARVRLDDWATEAHASNLLIEAEA